MNLMSSKSLIIPVETKVRELHGKCLLAHCAAEAGFEVILGDQRVIATSAHLLPRGIYIDKSIARTKTKHYHRLKQLGFSVVAWCEEGLVYRGRELYQTERVCPESLEALDAFFAWGDVQREDIIDAVPHAAEKIHAYGNPRFDMLSPTFRVFLEEQAKEIVGEFGPYILINTNFPRFNHYLGHEGMIKILRARGLAQTPEQQDFYVRLSDHLEFLINEFVKMIPGLAREFPDRSIILRPHPSENHDRWREQLSGIPNVQVLHQGDVLPWILGAETMIHNSCTTGVEAFLLNRSTISFMPAAIDEFDDLLPNTLSDRAQSLDELVDLVRKALSKKGAGVSRKRDRQALAARYIANMSGGLSAERIVETLLNLNNEASRQPPGRALAATAHLAAGLRRSAGHMRRILKPGQQLAEYMDQKFPGLSLGEVQSILDRISSVRMGSRRLTVSAHPSLASCFLIAAEYQSDIPAADLA